MNPYALSNLCVVLQLLVGELIFIYPYKKRKYFWVRLPVSFAICLLLAFFYPLIYLHVYNLNRLIQLVIFFTYTIVVCLICFDLKFKVTLSLCSAGYALQHIGYQLSTAFHNLPFGEGFTQFVSDYHRIVEMSIFVIFYIVYYFVFGKRIANRGGSDTNFNNVLNYLSVFVVAVCILLSLYSGNSNVPVFVSLYSIISCSLALVLQFAVISITRLNKENESIRLKMEADVARYESAKDAIDFINIKCHDIRKELTSIKDGINGERLKELKETIDVYDSVPHTGNAIVDTILLNATLHATQYGIRFTFSGNGEWLNFVNDTDLKSLFMNAISNAAEAAENVEPNKRNVSVVLNKKGDMVLLTVRNYYIGSRIAVGEEPTTTKKDNTEEHGFGLKSMRLVAKKYGGGVTISGTGEIFTLSVFLINN